MEFKEYTLLSAEGNKPATIFLISADPSGNQLNSLGLFFSEPEDIEALAAITRDDEQQELIRDAADALRMALA